MVSRATLALDAAGIAHVVIKGAHIRELIYSDAALRPACDVDILVSRSQRVEAIRALVQIGYRFRLSADTISHEACLVDGPATIDLHWDLLRPGRARRDLTDEIINTRRRFSTHWGPTDEATLFLMLVHPIFTKYLTAPQAKLIRIVDLARWLSSRQVDWGVVVELLERTGFRTAAWSSLNWLQLLTGVQAPADVAQELSPGRLRSTYLQNWICRDFSTRLSHWPRLVQLGFTLPVHDRSTDAMRAVRAAIHASRTGRSEVEQLTVACKV